MGDVNDLNLAKKLLSDFFENCEIDLPNDDPPDVVVVMADAERWGIEVTRVYQQVEGFKIKSGAAIENVPSETNVRNLWRFAKNLEDKFRKDNCSGYFLDLEGPGRFPNSDDGKTLDQWKKMVKEAVKEFVESNQDGPQRFVGGTIRKRRNGTSSWLISVGSGLTEMEPAVQNMLCRAIADKTRGLNRWPSDLHKRWLLLLNCYPLMDESCGVEREIRKLVENRQDCRGFDGIFWSGCPDRKLMPIELG